MEELIEKLEKLEPKPGDILVVTVRPGCYIDGERMIQDVLDIPDFPKDVIIFLTDGRINFDRLTEEEMNRFGWFRREIENESSDPS